MDRTRSLAELHSDFRAGSTTSMPIAGMICWGLLGVASTMLSARLVGTLALYIMAGILPLAVLLDRLKGRNLFATNGNPLDQLFLSSVAGVGVVVPLVLVAAKAANLDLPRESGRVRVRNYAANCNCASYSAGLT